MNLDIKALHCFTWETETNSGVPELWPKKPNKLSCGSQLKSAYSLTSASTCTHPPLTSQACNRALLSDEGFGPVSSSGCEYEKERVPVNVSTNESQ